MSSRPMRHRCRRERGEEAPPVPHRLQPRVENRQNPAVLSMADQPSEPLLQRQDRERDLVFAERRSAFGIDRLDPRGGDGISGGREGDLVDDHAAQRFTDHVDTLPETRRGKKDGVRCRPERTEECRTRRFPLHEDWIVELARGNGVDVPQCRVAGEEYEGPPRGCAGRFPPPRALPPAELAVRGSGMRRGKYRIACVLKSNSDGRSSSRARPMPRRPLR